MLDDFDAAPRLGTVLDEVRKGGLVGGAMVDFKSTPGHRHVWEFTLEILVVLLNASTVQVHVE